MNREIKFRCWDKVEKCFMDAVCLHSSGMISDSIGLQEHPVDPWQKLGERYEISFYTGLKDKNGKEIYEGDILSSGGTNEVVIFRHGMFISVPYWDKDETDISYPGDYEIYNESSEVIGNIYEDKDLL